MKIHELAPAPGSTRARRRVGRGIAGKGGKTAGRGTKGAGARGNIKPGFEGGQLPLTQRIPKLKGFKNPFRVEYTIVNLDALERLGRHRGQPRSPARRRAGPQEGHGEGARGRAVDPSCECVCPRLLGHGHRCHRGRWWFNSRATAALWPRSAARQGQRAYQSVARTARTGVRRMRPTDRDIRTEEN